MNFLGEDESESVGGKLSKSSNEKDDKKSKKGEPDILVRYIFLLKCIYVYMYIFLGCDLIVH